jgi:PAS domain S-box-containing protein
MVHPDPAMASLHAPRGGAHDDCHRQLLYAAGVALAIVDADGRWLEVNDALARLLGESAHSLLGCPLESALDAASQVTLRQACADVLDGRQQHVELALPWRRDGHGVATRTRIAALPDSRGHVGALLFELYESDARSDAPVQALEAAQRQLQLFADAVAHDLRAPLRSIESFSGLLAQRATARLDDTDRDYLARIRKAAARMASLLVALGDLSLATRAELRPGPVDLSLLAEWVGAELQEADPAQPGTVQVQPRLATWGDERLLKLMLAQLLGNAWKFSHGCESIRIEVDGDRDGDRMRVHVRDRGCGFDMQYAHKLFEPFQRLHGPDQGGGHGLGLAIAQCVARRHGGRIHAHSQPQGGSVFTIELPAVVTAEGAGDA